METHRATSQNQLSPPRQSVRCRPQCLPGDCAQRRCLKEARKHWGEAQVERAGHRDFSLAVSLILGEHGGHEGEHDQQHCCGEGKALLGHCELSVRAWAGVPGRPASTAP